MVWSISGEWKGFGEQVWPPLSESRARIHNSLACALLPSQPVIIVVVVVFVLKPCYILEYIEIICKYFIYFFHLYWWAFEGPFTLKFVYHLLDCYIRWNQCLLFLISYNAAMFSYFFFHHSAMLFYSPVTLDFVYHLLNCSMRLDQC